MTIHKVIEGIGFCATGSESDYILFIDDGGRTRTVSATDMVPVDARAGWAHLDALIGGFGEARSREHLETEYAKTPTPQAYRLRITVEAFPLTEAGTAALLKSALDRSIADEKEGIEAAKTELRGLFARVEATFEGEAMDWEAKYVAIWEHAKRIDELTAELGLKLSYFYSTPVNPSREEFLCAYVAAIRSQKPALEEPG